MHSDEFHFSVSRSGCVIRHGAAGFMHLVCKKGNKLVIKSSYSD